jgi:hypothetical protein
MRRITPPAAALALVLAFSLPHPVAAQQPSTGICQGGAQPITTILSEGGGFIGVHSLLTPLAPVIGTTIVDPATGYPVGAPPTDPTMPATVVTPGGIVTPTVVTSPWIFGSVLIVTQNFQGVQGLTVTTSVRSSGLPVSTLGVPSYLLEAYGGNITAIERDLAAGLLKDRGPCAR